MGKIVELICRYNRFMERSSDYDLATRAIAWLTFWGWLIICTLYGSAILLGYKVAHQ